MNELIKIEKSRGGKEIVSARDLHSVLESGKDFSSWIKVKLISNKLFTENKDYIVFPQKGENLKGGRPKIEYAITVDVAKHLALMENTQKGKEVRNYFIARDEELRNIQTKMLPLSYKEALKELIVQVEENEKKQLLLDEQKPKVVFAESVEASDKSILIGSLAKILKQNGIDIGQNKLFKYLRDNGYLCINGERKNIPTQKAMMLKLFQIKESIVMSPSGLSKLSITTKVTGKGQIYFVNKFLKLQESSQCTKI